MYIPVYVVKGGVERVVLVGLIYTAQTLTTQNTGKHPRRFFPYTPPTTRRNTAQRTAAYGNITSADTNQFTNLRSPRLTARDSYDII